MRGGLAQVSVVLSALMGGVSGSAIADAAMEARILGPDMINDGYSKGYASSILTVPSNITAIIPPSIALILYGTIGEVSVLDQYLEHVMLPQKECWRPCGIARIWIHRWTTSIRMARRSPLGSRSQRINVAWPGCWPVTTICGGFSTSMEGIRFVPVF